MFRAVREAWGRVREKRLIGLFVFEFVVVVLGVLTAQGVQAWAQERERREHATAERVRLEQGYAGAIEIAKIWRAALPCLHRRVGDIMRAASSGAPLSAAVTQRPRLVQQGYDATTPEILARIGKEAGTNVANTLDDVQKRIATIQAAQVEMRMQWELFRLLDPEFGQIGGADRATARAAGAAVLNQLRSIEFAADMIERQSALLTVKNATPFDREFGILPIRDCDEIWAKGTVYRKIEPGEAAPY